MQHLSCAGSIVEHTCINSLGGALEVVCPGKTVCKHALGASCLLIPACNFPIQHANSSSTFAKKRLVGRKSGGTGKISETAYPVMFGTSDSQAACTCKDFSVTKIVLSMTCSQGKVTTLLYKSATLQSCKLKI